MTVSIRPTLTEDSVAIQALFTTTFTDSDGADEGALVGNLSRDLMEGTSNEDLYGFVAIDEGQIVGSIFFSRMTFKTELEAFLLAPVGVHTRFQRKGIGQKLINHGLAEMKLRGVQLVITYGDPAYYSKVGFQPLAQDVVRPPFNLSQPIGWQGQSLTGDAIKPIPAPSKCVKALDNPAYW